MARLSWLHLSDLHMGTRGAGWLRPEYREELERDLRALHERTGPWDLVLLSGGLTLRSTQREFELLSTTLESFWVFLRNLGSEPFLLAVPGPHEAPRLDRDPDLLDARSVRMAVASPEPGKLKQTIEESFAPFVDWLGQWQRAHPPKGIQTSLRRGLLPGDFSLTVRKQGVDLGIVGLNSNFWMPDHAREISEEQLAMGSDQELRAWAHERNAVLLLTHHAPTELRFKALTLLLQHGIAPQGRFLLHLCGGQEFQDPKEPRSSLAHPVPYFQAPALFSSNIPNAGATPGQWGYAVGEFELRDTSGRIRLFPRVVSVTKLGSAVLVPDERYPLEKDESVTISFPVKEAVSPPAFIPPPAALAVPPRAAPPAPRAPPVPESPAGVKLQSHLSTGRDLVGWLAWAPTGEALAIGLSSGELRQWKPGTEAPGWGVQGHDGKIVDLCFSPDGQILASRDADLVRLWAVNETKATRGSAPIIKTRGQNVAWSSRGLLAVGSVYGFIELWDTKTWTQVASLPLGATLTTVLCLAWSPDGQTLACGGVGEDTLLLWDMVRSGNGINFERTEHSLGNDYAILHLAWMPGTKRLALAYRDGLLQLWDAGTAVSVAMLESHTDTITSVAFSFDGRLLASKSLDGTVRLFRTDTWEPVARLEEPIPRDSFAGLAFAPKHHVLASLLPGGRGVRTWELDLPTLLRSHEEPATVHAVSAKVVLVGEGRAGKSCLALRMVKDSYEELGSTHGMRFWSIPAEPPEAARGQAMPPQRELILWDMGGQSEYRLVHQLFLRDSTAALMVMEPGRGQPALDELEGWNQRLLAQTSTRPIQKLLVGTKLDDEHAPENLPALRHLIDQGKYTAYLPTSAKTGRGISELKRELARTIDWENIEKVSRPRLFQHIRHHLQRLRQAGRVVLLMADLQQELREGTDGPVEPEALRVVVAQLSRQGLVADTWLADGTRALILEVEQVERYAGSIILAARDNPHGVPAIDVATVMSPEMSFPRIPQQERLRRDQELMVLDCVIQMLLQHDLCLLHQGLLIFPSLFQPLQQDAGSAFTHAVSLCYDFSGPIDTIYASLIASLAMSQRFGAMRLWEDRAEFGRAGEDVSGVRKVQHVGQDARGLARLDVYFDTETPKSTRELFVNFVEQHLRKRGVKLLERLSVTCACGKEFPEEIVRERLDQGLTDIGCQRCDRRTPLTPGAQQAKDRDPELARQLEAMRRHVQEKRGENVAVAQGEINVNREPAPPETPLRILHLSDLHLGATDEPLNLLQPLIADLTDRLDGPGVERLDYLVISGDLTNRASPQEFEKAYQFVSGLIQEFGLTAERCIIVPGNHDLDWDTEVYVWKKKRQVDLSRLPPGSYRELADGSVLLRDEAKYPERFKNFSQHFYHPLQQKEYPLPAAQQCVVSSFFDSRLQFLALNSAWQIDESFQERSGIHEGALSHGLAEAERQLVEARRTGKLRGGDKVLRLSVLHHPITGNEKVQDDAFLKRLQQAEVRLCLHGHVHEDRADLLGYLHPTRKLHVMGAGSFGAPTHHRPESVPRLYNLLEVRRDLGSVRVHTRGLHKQGGAWEARAVWPGEKPSERRPFYEVKLP